jgi:hypothetical protein
MKVDIETLRKTLNLLLDLTSEMRGEAFEIADGLYWFVHKTNLYDESKPPTRLTLGSLQDDWSEIVKIADDPELAIEYAFVWCTSILRAIGDGRLCSELDTSGIER